MPQPMTAVILPAPRNSPPDPVFAGVMRHPDEF